MTAWRRAEPPEVFAAARKSPHFGEFFGRVRGAALKYRRA
jgi:hypothetical protein